MSSKAMMGQQQQGRGQQRQTGPALESQATLHARSRAFTVWTEGELAPNLPVLVVEGRLASPRHLKCRWGTLLDIRLQVGSAVNFRRGMEIRGAFQREPGEGRIWAYVGKLPRRLGQW